MKNCKNVDLSKVLQSEEYQNNQMQIDVIKKVLINHSDVPAELVDWLITAVERNNTLLLEYKFNNKKVLDIKKDA